MLAGKTIRNYRISHLLGEGGMGAVYVAHDETLMRDVALKSIRTNRRLDEVARARFMREARVLSSLDHPNICRIFDFIRADDADYLVLELIDGTKLAHANGGDLDHSARLKIAAQIADVLVAAHAAGIVHRDLKPDNIMVTRQGDAKVLDFGLARPLDENANDDNADASTQTPQPESAIETIDSNQTVRVDEARNIDHSSRFLGDMTISGQVMGTPLYMSPEQASGHDITAASDMYSFGLVLQYIFCRAEPYEEHLDVAAILEKARRGDTLDASCADSDLVALINDLKSMTPGKRPTAVQVAERLQWITTKPKRRRRRLTVATLAIIAIAAGITYTVHLDYERDRADGRRHQAENLITFMVGDLRERLNAVGRLDLLNGVGDKAIEYFESVPADDLTDEELSKRAMVFRQIGEVRIAEGDINGASDAFAFSHDLSTSLARRDPSNQRWLFEVGQTHFWSGSVCWMLEDMHGALASFDNYLDVANQLVAMDATNLDWQQEIAYAQTNRGAVLEALGDTDAALEAIRGSIAIKRTLVDSAPENQEWKRSLANGLSWLARTYESSGALNDALEQHAAELEIRKDLCSNDVQDIRDELLLATTHGHNAELHTALENRQQAIEHLKQNVDILKRLTEFDPLNQQWRRDFAVALQMQAGGHLRLGEIDLATVSSQQAHRIMDELVASDPTNLDWRIQFFDTQIQQANVARANDDHEAAAAFADSAITLMQNIHDDEPTRRVIARLANALASRARILHDQGQNQAAADAWNESLTVLEALIDSTTEYSTLEIWASTLVAMDDARAPDAVRRLLATGYRSTALEQWCQRQGIELTLQMNENN